MQYLIMKIHPSPRIPHSRFGVMIRGNLNTAIESAYFNSESEAARFKITLEDAHLNRTQPFYTDLSAAEHFRSVLRRFEKTTGIRAVPPIA